MNPIYKLISVFPVLPVLTQIPIQNVDSIPILDQNLFPIIRSETESGRLLSNAQSNHENSCQVIFAAITEYARIRQSWEVISYQYLCHLITKKIPAANIGSVDKAIRKNIISAIEFNHELYIVPNAKKFKKYLDNNFIPALNT